MFLAQKIKFPLSFANSLVKSPVAPFSGKPRTTSPDSECRIQHAGRGNSDWSYVPQVQRRCAQFSAVLSLRRFAPRCMLDGRVSIRPRRIAVRKVGFPVQRRAKSRLRFRGCRSQLQVSSPPLLRGRVTWKFYHETAGASATRKKVVWLGKEKENTAERKLGKKGGS